MSTEDYCLRWEEGKQLSSVGPWSSSIDDLKNNEAFWDIKLVTEESEIKCHKFILGASSPHLRKIIQRLGPVMNPVLPSWRSTCGFGTTGRIHLFRSCKCASGWT